jgi:hypothetical protein
MVTYLLEELVADAYLRERQTWNQRRADTFPHRWRESEQLAHPPTTGQPRRRAVRLARLLLGGVSTLVVSASFGTAAWTGEPLDAPVVVAGLEDGGRLCATNR